MGTDINAFVEYADDGGDRSFSGRPDEAAWFFGKFSLSRDYDLFDALGEGRSSPMEGEDPAERSLYAPRGLPADVSLEVAWEYYDLVVDDQAPDVKFWRRDGCVSGSQAEERVHEGAHLGSVAQSIHYGMTDPRTWQVVSKKYLHTPSWLTLQEIHQSLDHHRLPLTELCWDFRALLKCLSATEDEIGRGQVRLVFWFDI